VPKSPAPKSPKKRRGAVLWLIAAAIAAFVIYTVSSDGEEISTAAVSVDSAVSGETTARPTATPEPTATPFNAAVVSFPANGTVRYYADGARSSGLGIETSSTSQNYYVVLADAQTGKKAVALYVRGGQEVHVDVPVGTYYLYYACGATWYGETELFGPEGGYSKADSSDAFESGYEWTYTLYTVYDGNMSTEDIDLEDFPG